MCEMTERCYGVNHCIFEIEFCSVHTQNDNLGDSILYLNAIITPEVLVL